MIYYSEEAHCQCYRRNEFALYSRVSTDLQTTENQARELRAYAERMGYKIVAELADNGISGTKGRCDRPAYNRLLQMIARKEIDLVLSWSVEQNLSISARLVVIPWRTEGEGGRPLSAPK